MLGTADVFENLGVGAYNGAGQLIQNVDYLAAAGSIVSVEARHAATIALLTRGFGRDAAGGKNVDRKGLDEALNASSGAQGRRTVHRDAVHRQFAGLRRDDHDHPGQFHPRHHR